MHYSLALFLAPMQTRLKSSVLNEIFRKKEGREKSNITYIRNEDPTNYKNVSLHKNRRNFKGRGSHLFSNTLKQGYGVLPPDVSGVHCLLRLPAQIYHLLKRQDCILNRLHHGLGPFCTVSWLWILRFQMFMFEQGLGRRCKSKTKEMFCSSHSEVEILHALA